MSVTAELFRFYSGGSKVFDPIHRKVTCIISCRSIVLVLHPHTVTLIQFNMPHGISNPAKTPGSARPVSCELSPALWIVYQILNVSIMTLLLSVVILLLLYNRKILTGRQLSKVGGVGDFRTPTVLYVQPFQGGGG